MGNNSNLIKESIVDDNILKILLKDHTTDKNIIWANDEYSKMGIAFSFYAEIQLSQIEYIKPRIEKDKQSQQKRSKDKAEVFTPSWICNKQNNLIDDAWFGSHTNRFNKEIDKTWETTYPSKKTNKGHIIFPKGKSFEDYVTANRLEISCGEAPYLTSRYDTVSGKFIPPKNRIGLLDRKLRVISENIDDFDKWLIWAEKALQATYGFEWQGDNILLARENLLLDASEFCFDKFGKYPPESSIKIFADIISYNIFQMDGIKFVIPNSCKDETENQITFGGNITKCQCEGCRTGDKFKHNGIYAKVRDWQTDEYINFVDLQKERKVKPKLPTKTVIKEYSPEDDIDGQTGWDSF